MKEPYFEPQGDFIKKYTKMEKILIGKNHTHLYFSSDFKVLHVIPVEYCLLDVDRILDGKTPFPENTIKSFMDTEYEKASITGYRKIELGEMAVIEGEHASAWVQRKYLREFPENVEFGVVNERTVVQVMYNGEVCGYILPVNHREGA